jgi:hypothetical protein
MSNFFVSEKIAYLSDIDSSRYFALSVLGSEFSDSRNGVQAGIFGKRVWDDLQSLSECSEAVLFHTRQCVCIFSQTNGKLDLRRTTTHNQSSTITKQYLLKVYFAQKFKIIENFNFFQLK